MGSLVTQRSDRKLQSGDGELFAKVQQAGKAETEAAIAAAHGAYKAWAATPVFERESVFIRAADVLAAKSKEIIDVLVQESGSVAGKAGFEVHFCFDLLRTAAAEMRRSPGETMPLTAPGQFGFTIRQPLGVIAGIAPFNAPFLLAMKKIVLALAAKLRWRWRRRPLRRRRRVIAFEALPQAAAKRVGPFSPPTASPPRLRIGRLRDEGAERTDGDRRAAILWDHGGTFWTVTASLVSSKTS